jgi:hypothetical protein
MNRHRSAPSENSYPSKGLGLFHLMVAIRLHIDALYQMDLIPHYQSFGKGTLLTNDVSSISNSLPDPTTNSFLPLLSEEDALALDEFGGASLSSSYTGTTSAATATNTNMYSSPILVE